MEFVVYLYSNFRIFHKIMSMLIIEIQMTEARLIKDQ